MAKIYRNIYMRGLNGVDGDQAVYCTIASGKTVFVRGNRSDGNWNYMSMSIPKRKPAAIRAAALYAGFARTQDVYLDLECATGVSAYTLAIADWYGSPKVLEIDVDGWTGGIGQTIRVKARDNIMVAAVTVVIRDPQRNFLEMGEAVKPEGGGPWWSYTTQTQVNMSPFPVVAAIVQDLPGNRDAFVIR
jgi:hypothetical protein